MAPRIRKVAKKRSGLSAYKKALLDRHARWLCMLEANAFKMDNGAWYGPCEACKKESYLQWAHMVSGRARWRVRWDSDNCAALCSSCHYWLDKVATVPEKYEWLCDKFGAERVEMVHHESRHKDDDGNVIIREPLDYDKILKEINLKIQKLVQFPEAL